MPVLAAQNKRPQTQFRLRGATHLLTVQHYSRQVRLRHTSITRVVFTLMLGCYRCYCLQYRALDLGLLCLRLMRLRSNSIPGRERRAFLDGTCASLTTNVTFRRGVCPIPGDQATLIQLWDLLMQLIPLAATEWLDVRDHPSISAHAIHDHHLLISCLFNMPGSDPGC